MSTICAISTPPGIGGIAVIRVSGNDAFTVCDKVFKAKNKEKTLDTQKGYTLLYGEVKNPENNETVDEVMVAVFRAPHSFTGENIVEISCHGSLYIQQEILKLLLGNGCTMAKAGEFTQRAFLNGKMDLSQAEAVADLIASNSAASNRLAINQMRGGFSSELGQLREKLLNFTSLVELELDFSEEDVEFADREKLYNLAKEIEAVLKRLTNSFAVGNAIKNGIPVAIVGETNVGKSTLLNRLLNEERAIVSAEQGTTRDTIEDTMVINGILFRFIDTAGIRDTTNNVERIGIERTFSTIAKADIVLWLIDGVDALSQIDTLGNQIIKLSKNKKLLTVVNKTDKISDMQQKSIADKLAKLNCDSIFISAKQNMNVENLEQKLLQFAQLPDVADNDVIVTNLRHYEALKKSLQSIRLVQNGLENHLSGDFLSQDIRECIFYLGSITGQITTDEVLGNIFSKFCIGK